MARTTNSAAARAKPAAKSGSQPSGVDEYAGYDVLLVNSLITNELFNDIFRCVSKNRVNDNVVLCLVTYGGLANPAYRISRHLQTVYKDVVVFVPSFCKSAGTLIVTGANKVLMSPLGEIGPLDVQLPQRDELGERKSGLTFRWALEDMREHSFELFEHFMMQIKAKSGGTISFQLAAELASAASTGLMSKVYDQISPEALGTDYRDLSVATKYGERLDRRFMNLKPGAMERLVREYPSHDFVIDFGEATELFNRVDRPSPALYDIVLKDEGTNMLVTSMATGFVKMASIDGVVAEAVETVVSGGGENGERARTNGATAGGPS